MIKIYFGTHNTGKLREFKEILSDVAELEHIEAEIDERRSDDPCEIVKDKAERLANKYQKNIVCDDSGLFITKLNGFPGTCSAYIHKKIGLSGILKLMEGLKDEERECEYHCAVAYCEPGSKPVSFLGKEKGRISESEKGSFGFGHDPIFIPESNFSSGKTYAEDQNLEKVKKFRRDAVIQMVEYLKKRG